MSRASAWIRANWQEFRNVFGARPGTILPRLDKGLRVLMGMLHGDNVAASCSPVRLQVEVTDRCNFNCIMCNRLTRENVSYRLTNDMNYATFKRLVDDVDPYYITLNGLGEPALNPAIGDILRLCRQRGITTQMPSNMSVKRATLEQVAQCPPSILTFSMHGATKKSFEGISTNANFETCLEIFEAFCAKVDRRTVEIRILCALQAKNLMDYDAMFGYLSRWGLLDHFSLIPVIDYQLGDTDERRVLPTPHELSYALDALERDIPQCNDPRKRTFLERWRGAVQAVHPAEEIFQTGPCLIPWFSTYITARGNVLPCCYLTGEYHVLGNVLKEDFRSIWNGPRYRQFRRQIRENRGQLAGCRNCWRNDASALRRYNPLGLVRSKWRVIH